MISLLKDILTGNDLCILDFDTGAFSSVKMRPPFFVSVTGFSTSSVVSAMNCSP